LSHARVMLINSPSQNSSYIQFFANRLKYANNQVLGKQNFNSGDLLAISFC